ncbi:MAG TPA: prolipoprotein diacylglyceryl transferase [Deltaproteobacteria bacterium]|nr:prolipoprotein diacylglyceryl transferase [Deltaproteobacteria bacterium]
MNYPLIDPVLIQIGPFAVRWYGLMYIIGFVLAYVIMRRVSRLKDYDMSRQEIEDLLAYCVLGLVIGARLGYCLFYNAGFYLANPLKIFAVWEGGMSFHGGLIGLVVTVSIFAYKRKKPFLTLADLGAVAAPPGLFFGRIGNFINAELYGRVTEVPWGMVFPGAGSLPRHPSQLYEAFFEGIVLFVLLYVIGKKTRTPGIILSLFLVFYGLMRFCIEFFREPDAQLGFIFFSLTMGQILSLAMVAFGVVLLAHRLKSR